MLTEQQLEIAARKLCELAGAKESSDWLMQHARKRIIEHLERLEQQAISYTLVQAISYTAAQKEPTEADPYPQTR